MYKLFSLILVVAMARGAEGVASLSFSFSDQLGDLDIFRDNGSQNTKSSILQLDLKLPTIKNYWTVASSFNASKKDYSTFFVRDDKGIEAPLSKNFDQQEYTARCNISYKRGNYTFSVFAAGSLGDTPFPFKALAVSYNRTFLNRKRILGGRIIGSHKKQPSSTFLEPKTYKIKDHPGQLNTIRYQLSWNEILNQNWRVLTIASYGTRREDRPDHYGLEIKNGFGINNGLTFRVHTGIIKELRSELKNDRGYFDISWIETSSYWEFQYDYAAELAYGFSLERESFDDDRIQTRIGTNSYGIKFYYMGVKFDLFSSYVFRDVNTGYQSHTIQGGISWGI